MSGVNAPSTSFSVSEYRGGSKFGDKSNDNENSKVKSKAMSFSSIVKASSFPKKDQAVVFPVVEGLQIRDYVIATGEVVKPEDMQFVSRMSNNRVCMYFSSKQVVDSFIDEYGGIEVNGMFIPARKLILPAQRLILSNVSPFIPHSVLEEELRDRGLKLVSPISFIGAGIGIDKFRHMCSFRRQVFISTDQKVEIPSSVNVIYEEEEYHIFLSDGKIRCFVCKEEGHIAANCKASPIDLEMFDRANKRPPPPAAETLEEASIDVQDGSQPSVAGTPTTSQENQTADKTPSSEQVGIIDDQTIQQDPPPKSPVSDVPESLPKRFKIDPQVKAIDPSKEIEQNWQDSNSKPLNCIDMIQFLNDVKGSNKPIQVARKYTDDINGLLAQIKIVQQSVSDRTTKERCKRLSTSLKKTLLKEGKPVTSPPLSRSSSTSSLRPSQSQESVNSATSY